MQEPSIYRYSPKPDWLIFRDIARRIGRELDPDASVQLEAKLSNGNAFFRDHSGQVADDMAASSNRTEGMGLGQMLQFAKSQSGVDPVRAIHSILGAGQTDGSAPNLKDHYRVAEEERNPFGAWSPMASCCQ